jgi:divinyl chlorophyllide a 8-vinyl-reductase
MIFGFLGAYTMDKKASMTARPKQRIFFLGATGTIGRATVRILVAQGHDVVCFVRSRNALSNPDLAGAEIRIGDVLDSSSLRDEGFRGEYFDAVVSTLASRTGVPTEAWSIDYGAHVNALKLAQDMQITRFVLLSALCVQKPRLAFQHAKLAFESELMASGLTYSIVRPTAFFKSLSGQIRRVKAGKPYLIFGNGQLTSCKPISDQDLGHYLASCLHDCDKRNKVLPIGGPGLPITPREQGEMIFAALGRTPKFQSVPLALLKSIRATLSLLGRFNGRMADKAEMAAIGLYYGTESMLVLDPETGRYNGDLTPSTGQDTLQNYFERLIRNEIADDRGDHAVF